MKDQFIVQKQGKTFVLYAGLLDEAHARGLKRIETQLLQIPTTANDQVAIAQAAVETEAGIFHGIGDASPANVPSHLVNAIIRMAETRAKARALRDAVNIGCVSLEETSDEELEAPAVPTPGPSRSAGSREPGRSLAPDPTPLRPHATDAHADATPKTPHVNGSVDANAITPAQRRAIEIIASERNIPSAILEAEVLNRYKRNLAHLTKQQASQLMTLLKTAEIT